MDTEKLLSRGAVLVPLVHVVACGLYIAGYSIGFGGQIGGMFSASDFFTVTIQHLAAVYIAGLGFPLVVLAARHRSGTPYAADQIAAETDANERTRLIARRERYQRTFLVLLPTMSVLMLVALLLQIWAGSLPLYQSAFTFIWMGILPFWWGWLERVGLHGARAELLWIATTFALSVVGLGVGNGDLHRRGSYSELRSGRMICKKNVILSSIGDRFLTVTSDNVRHVVNDECEEFAKFEKVPVAPTEPFWVIVGRKLRADAPDGENVSAVPIAHRSPIGTSK